MYCQHCGSEVQDGVKFCSNCGNPVANGINKNPGAAAASSEKNIKGKQKKGTTPGQIVLITVVWLVIILLVIKFFSGFSSNNKSSSNNNTTNSSISIDSTSSSPQTTQVEWHELSPKSVFDIGGYIEYEGVYIGYEGDNTFLVENDTDTIYGIQCSVYGIKKDGTSEWIGTPSFAGVDKVKYEQEKEENGWAIEKSTNIVRPHESLEMEIYFVNLGDEYPSWDIDGDGYYDISFTLRPQKDEDHWSFSTDDPQTDYYKLRAE